MNLLHSVLFASIAVFFAANEAAAADGHNHLFGLSGCRACRPADSGDRPRFVVEEISTDGISPVQLQALLDSAHDTIELESQGGFLRRWRDQFQFKRLMLNAYRWYSVHKERPEVANAAANITGLLLASETLEAIGGLDLASYGAARGDWMGAGMIAVGVALTSPISHPLCLILVGAYKKWPESMNKMLTVPRLFVVYSTSAGSYMLTGRSKEKVKEVVEAAMKSRFVNALGAGPDGFEFQTSISGDAEFVLFGPNGDDQYIEMRMERQEDGRQALVSVSFSEPAGRLERTQLKRMLKPFGVNISDFLLEIAARIRDGRANELRTLKFVERVEGDPVTVKLQRGAFPFFSLADSDFSCEDELRPDL